MTTQDPARFRWYYDALAGQRGELTGKDPQPGYYRQKHSAVAFWDGESGVVAMVTEWKDGEVSSYSPKEPDRINELFGWACVNPIDYQVYEAFVATGRWPETVDMPNADPNLPEYEQIAQRIDLLKADYDKWFAGLSNGIDSEDTDTKAKSYATSMQSLKKEAEERHAALKRPILEEGRTIDGNWKPVQAKADDAKRLILAPTKAYRRKRAAEEEARRQEQIARQRAAQQEAVAKNEMPAPVFMPPKKPTGLRTVKVLRVTSYVELANFIARMNERSRDFEQVCEKIARKILEAGGSVPGASLEDEKRVGL